MKGFNIFFRRSAMTLATLGGLITLAYGQSIIANPGFETGTSPWQFYSNGSATFANDALGAGSAKAGHIVILQEGSNVQLYQTGFPLEANSQYTLSFKAYSNTGHDLAISVIKHTSPYSSYGLVNQFFDLTASWNTYTVQFTTSGFSGTVTDARLQFWLAPYDANNDLYFIDDVLFNKVGSSGNTPPSITAHPANQTVASGQTATFVVTASGDQPLSYQWQKNTVNISGATAPSYTTPPTAGGDNGSTFQVIVSNPYGTTTSNSALLTVTQADPSGIVSDDFHTSTLNTSLWTFVNPENDASYSITGAGTQDALLNLSVPGGTPHDVWGGDFAPRIMQAANNSDFEVEAKFQANLTAQYEMQGIIVQQDASNFIRFDFVKDNSNLRVYSATFTNNAGTTRGDVNIAQGNPLYLRVKRQGNQWTESYSYNGTSWTVAVSYSFTLSVTAVGPFAGNQGNPSSSSPPFTGLVDYFFNTASPISPEDGGGGGGGSAPVITTQPSNQTVASGQTATFSVTASGDQPLSYQWQKNTVNISGATAPSYTTPPTAGGDNGSTFQVIVSNPYGTTTSNSALLTVTQADPSGIVSDDFHTSTLNTSLWTFVNPENDASYSITGAGTQDALLNLSVPGGTPHDVWGGDFAPRLMQAANNADFEVEAKFQANMTAQYEMQGIIVQQDANNFIRFDFVKDNSNLRVYSATFTNNAGTMRGNVNIAQGNPLYLRVKRQGNQWTESYSYNGTRWTVAVSYSFTLSVTAVGPFAGNQGNPSSSSPPFTGLVDYFFNTASPISPEDGGGGGGGTAPVITTQPSNQTVASGQTATFSVTVSGDQPLSYQWQKNNANISGATISSYTTPATTSSDNGAAFRCIVSNSVGSTTSSSATLTVTSTTHTPYLGTPFAIPGTIQGEDFDNGGEGVAYHDLDAANQGGQYRSTGVDIENTSDPGGGYDIGWIHATEWLEYTVNVPTAGTYTINARVASSGSGGSLHVELGGINKTGAMAVPNTGNWQVYQTISKSGVSLSAGQQILRISFDVDGSAGVVCNLNYISIDAGSSSSAPTITAQPSNQTVAQGQTATFAVAASGSSPLAYQWQKNNANIGGATNTSYTTPAVTTADNGSSFRCIVSNSFGSATSNAATLTVQSGPAAYPTWTHLSSTTGNLPVPNGGTQQTAALVLDVDRDGVNDFVIGERTAAPSVVWYRRSSSGWTKYVIDNTQLTVEAGGAFYDIDGDGDLDIVFGSDSQGNQMWWWENPYPNYNPSTPWARHIIKNSGASQHHDELFGDFKGDGHTELVFWNQGANTLYMAPIPASPRNDNPWPLTPIYTYSGSIHEGLAKFDIDGDGIIDIVGGGNWYKYNGNGTFTANVIDNNMIFTRASAGQLKPGGRAEVVFQAGDWDGPLSWYEWTGSSWTAHQLLATVVHGHSLQVADINGDGNQDIFSAEMRLDGGNANAKMRIFYGDGQGNFVLNEIAAGFCNHESRVADLDGDGDLDILDKSYDWATPRIDVWINNGAGVSSNSLESWTYIQADNSRGPSVFGNGTFGLGFADLNNDGYKDIASGHYFYRNPGGGMTTTPWPRVTLPNNPQTGHSVDAFLLFDAEGTGAQNDIIAEDLPYVLWLKANDAQGTSWTPAVIDQIPATSHGNGRTVKLAHIIPGNSKPDILLSGGDGTYLMQIPASTGGSWPIMKITTSSNDEQKAIGVGDINRDGNADIAVAVGADRLEVDWWSNPGNATSNWTKHVIGNTAATVKMIEVADVNGDGRLDVIVTEEARPAAVYWFEAPADPVNGTWIRHTVATGLDEIDSMSGIDMNNDGKPDIVVGEILGNQRLIIYENVNYGASWNTHIVDSGKESHNGARAVDLDNDGHLDIVSIAYNNYAYMHVWRNDAAPSPQGPGSTPPLQRTATIDLPRSYSLMQNYPNPFNPATTIAFEVPVQSHVTLRIFNMLSQEVATLVDEVRAPGRYEVRWNAAGLASGAYVYRLEAGSFISTKKMILLK